MVGILIGLCYPSMVLGLSMMLEVISMSYYKLKNHNLTPKRERFNNASIKRTFKYYAKKSKVHK